MGLREIVIDMDKEVQRFYTRIGRKIPEKHLYKLTLPLGVFGGNEGLVGMINLYNLSYVLGFGGATFVGLNVGVDIISMDLTRNLPEGAASYHNAFVDFLRSINKRVRLPIFLAGTGHIGKFIYDAANYFLNGEPMSDNSFLCLQTGAGLLGLASSIYLKDQDPRLLERRTVDERVAELYPVNFVR